MIPRRYKMGVNRQQSMLLPPTVDEYVSEDNLARAIDAYVDSCDLAALGFALTTAPKNDAGQPAYAPGDMLKLYLYGYLHRVRSSRRLEQETYRNLEVIWLLRGLTPSYKTIADFRKHNANALKAANRDFVQLCQALDLYGGERVAIDGTFIHGNASQASIVTEKSLAKQAERMEQAMAQYLAELDQADQQSDESPRETAALQEKLTRLQERQAQLHADRERLAASGQTQLSRTDPDARLLNKGNGTVQGYNAQIAVDDRHKLIVCCEVTQDGNDSQQLAPMARQAKDTLGVEQLVVEADSSYCNYAHLKDCEDEGITPYVAIPDKSRPVREEGRFAREDFTYDEPNDCYHCPGGHTLTPQGQQTKRGQCRTRYVSKANACHECPLKGQCLPEKTPYRQIYRWEHEAVVERHRARMAADGREHMRSRASLAEHPFGTLKLWFGWTHFLVRGLKKVTGDMNLMMLCYNLRRAITLFGVEGFRQHCAQRALA